MDEILTRTALLLGEEGVHKLQAARVAVFGVGGVGGYAVEALARSGIGNIELVDGDVVALSNFNRQIIATKSTLGMKKAIAFKERIADINPNIQVNARDIFFDRDSVETFDFREYDYVVDAIDSVASKVLLIEEATKAGTPIISCMGMGNKLDPTRIEVADISKTAVCPLARVVRQQLKKRGITHLKTVFSKEEPIAPHENSEKTTHEDGKAIPNAKRLAPGSVSFVPSVAGLIIAGEVIKDLLKK